MTRDRTWLAMAAFAAVAVFGVLARPLLPIDETRYLTVAWDMRLDGDWLVPHLNGAAYPDKPPLLFWLINLVWSVTGVSEIAARLVAPASGLAAIWATSRLARRLWPEDAGVGGRAAMILAGLGTFTLFAGLTMFDAMLTLAVIAGAFAIFKARDGWLGWVGLGAALAVGGMSKGPVILVHLTPLALTAPLWAGIPLRRTLAGFALAIVVGLGLVGLWLAPAVMLGGPEYREAVLWTQSAGRMTSSFAHNRPWWFFLTLTPVLLWPFGWSVGLWRQIAALDLRGDAGLRLAVIWAASAFVLFSLMSGKQTHYLLPTLPAVALLFARAMRGAPAAAPLAALPLVGLGLAGLAAAAGLASGDMKELLQPPLAAALLGLGLLGLAFLGLRRLRGPGLAWLAFGTVTLVNLVFLIGAPGRTFDTGPIAALVAPADAAGVAVLGRGYQGEFTFAARLRNPVATVTPREAEDWLAAAPGRRLVARLDRDHPDWPPLATANLRNHVNGVWGADPNAAKGEEKGEDDAATE